MTVVEFGICIPLEVRDAGCELNRIVSGGTACKVDCVSASVGIGVWSCGIWILTIRQRIGFLGIEHSF